MAIYLLDSNIVVEVINGKNNRDAILRNLILAKSILACCGVTWTEIYAGMRDHERERTERYLSSLEYLDITPQVAKHAGLLKRDLQRNGITLSLPDVMIAAVAIENNATLITLNTKHFPMPEINLYPLNASWGRNSNCDKNNVLACNWLIWFKLGDKNNVLANFGDQGREMRDSRLGWRRGRNPWRLNSAVTGKA